MNLNSRNSLWKRLRQGKGKRTQFVESHLNKGIAYQIRAIREKLGWSQERLANEVGMPQNAISRLESPDYGRATLTSLRRLAATYDVGLVVRFVPFSQMVNWVSGTPHTDKGLNSEALAVPSFEEELSDVAFDDPSPRDVSLVYFARVKDSNRLLADFPVSQPRVFSGLNAPEQILSDEFPATGDIPRKPPGVFDNRFESHKLTEAGR